MSVVSLIWDQRQDRVRILCSSSGFIVTCLIDHNCFPSFMALELWLVSFSQSDRQHGFIPCSLLLSASFLSFAPLSALLKSCSLPSRFSSVWGSWKRACMAKKASVPWNTSLSQSSRIELQRAPCVSVLVVVLKLAHVLQWNAVASSYFLTCEDPRQPSLSILPHKCDTTGSGLWSTPPACVAYFRCRCWPCSLQICIHVYVFMVGF